MNFPTIFIKSFMSLYKNCVSKLNINGMTVQYTSNFFPKMAKFSIFGKLFRFWKIKVFRFWKITSKKQVFQPRKKSDYVGVSKTKTNFYCIFFSNFWPREKKFDLCVFNLRTHLFSIFGKFFFENCKNLENRQNH